ncbi:MAG: type II toxin-antitoxin system HicB family antitoxin [Candidatus Poribacteria bacterium]|nr:type II toxin-antitoxin system HicB family antitoxin [Candidatus Poribacteria bacterium]
MSKEIYRISVILTPQPEGGYTVTCKELPELFTEGDSVEEALENVDDAFITTLELYEDFDRELPNSIRMKNVDAPEVMNTVRFQTMTPRLETDPIPANDSFWFQAVVPGLESRITAV